jgi:FAD/FMN-containing dehydrogenase/Fe-S oxidoreductase
LRDDWKGHFRGDLLLDEVARGLYATDASLFEVEPLAVAVPRDETDLQFLVRYAFDKQIPLIARGAGTGLAGEALGPGLVVDLSVNFRDVVEIGTDTVRVQPGVVLRNLNELLAKHGRRFAPDPASAASCTIGGMLATDASGGNVLVHGYTRDHVVDLRVVWDNGETSVVRSPQFNDHHTGNGSPRPIAGDEQRTADISAAVIELLQSNGELIAASQPRTAYNRCGYRLHKALGPRGLDLPALLVGSEGTLAFFSEATLRTIPLASGRSAVLLGFESLDAAVRGADFARPMRPSACELLDRRLLTLSRGHSTEIAKLIPASAEAVLLVEFERDDPDDARQAGLELIDAVQRLHRIADLALPAFDQRAIERLRLVREAALPTLYALGKGPRPLAFVEDIGVLPEALPEFLNRAQSILQHFQTTASFFIHAATGQVHTRPFLDLGNPDDAARLWAIADQIHGLAIDLGGTISTQHGTGIARTPWVEKQYGRLFPVFRELKRIFDPRGILNPGKIVGPDPSRPAWPLRSVVRGQGSGVGVNEEDNGQRTEDRAPLLVWRPEEMPAQVGACNGCGACRTEDSRARMCPIFRIDRGESATPRAKANLLRHVLASANGKCDIGAEEIREVADLCVNCKMCAHECPAHVNIPKLMLEAKAVNQAEHGLDRGDWALARIESFAAVGSNFALITNTLLGSRVFRWVAEKLFGLSRRRRLPAFAARSFLKRAKRRGWTRKKRGGPKVAYFSDIFANFNDPLIAEATIAVLRHHGIDVHVPPGQKGCGMALLAKGEVELARERVGRNLRVLVELARDGYTIVCSEPTAAVMLRQDALDLIDDPDAQLVADHTVELTTFLWRMHEEGRLRTDFRPLELSLGHHVPCHLKALGAGVHGPALLSLIPGLTVNTIDVGCSGMAGTFGLQAKNFAVSLAAGKPMLDAMSGADIGLGSTECSTCRMQMEQGSGKRTLHPIQYLALAYGLMPEITRKMREPLRERVSS